MHKDPHGEQSNSFQKVDYEDNRPLPIDAWPTKLLFGRPLDYINSAG